MTEPLRGKGPQERLLAERSRMPSGAMQVVLMHALQLRRSCREIFLLCEIQGHSVEEAAVILGISSSAAKRRLLVAQRRMDEVIERMFESAGNEPPS